MRYAIVMVVAFMLAGCAGGPATQAHAAYDACLKAKPVEQCANEKARFEAAVEYANAVSRRQASAPPLMLGTGWHPLPQQPIYQPTQPMNCINMGAVIHCY